MTLLMNDFKFVFPGIEGSLKLAILEKRVFFPIDVDRVKRVLEIGVLVDFSIYQIEIFRENGPAETYDEFRHGKIFV